MRLFKRLSRSERTEKNYQKWLKSYVPNGTKQTIQLSIAITDRAGNNYYTYFGVKQDASGARDCYRTGDTSYRVRS